MSNSIKALVILGVIVTTINLVLPLYPADSLASPLSANSSAQVTPPQVKAANAATTLYLPLVFSGPRPAGPLYFPFLARPNPPTPTPTPVTPTPIPGPIRNGGFEDPNTASGPWYATRRDPTTGVQEGIDVRKDRATLATVGVSPHVGNYAAWLDDQEYEIYLQQEITLTAGTSTLTYWAWIKSDEPNCNTDQLDGAWVFFITTQQNQLESYALCKPNVTTGWVKHTLSISSYAGQTGWLTFVIRNLGQASSLFLDDVSVGN